MAGCFIDVGVQTRKELKVEHLYQHDAGSFIWVLTWVSLRYEDGRLWSNGRPLDVWLRVDAKGCHEKNISFRTAASHKLEPSLSHGSNWPIVGSTFDIVSLHYAQRRKAPAVDEVFDG